MKQNLQEVRRMQFLAGIVSEQVDIYSGEEQEVGRLGEVRPRKELPVRDLTAELAKGLDQAGIDYEMSMEGEHGELIKMIHPETQGTIFAGQDSGGITIDGDLGDNDPDMIDVSVEEALEYLKGLYGGGLQEGMDNISDEEKIDRWYWDSNPSIENLSQEEIEDGIKAHQEEWLGSKRFYDNIEDYFQDVERQGDWY